MINIASKIKNIRNSEGLSQTQFANDLNISRSGVAQIESGKTNPSFDFINKVVKVYNVAPEYFFSNENVYYKVQENVQENDSPINKDVIFSRNDLDILNSILSYPSIDDILRYCVNSYSRNQAILISYKKELKEYIQAYNRLCNIFILLRIKDENHLEGKFNELNFNKVINGIFEDDNPEEWNENFKFENKNILISINIISFKNSIEHTNFLIANAIEYLEREIVWRIKTNQIKL